MLSNSQLSPSKNNDYTVYPFYKGCVFALEGVESVGLLRDAAKIMISGGLRAEHTIADLMNTVALNVVNRDCARTFALYRELNSVDNCVIIHKVGHYIYMEQYVQIVAQKTMKF